jgi:3'-5' exonuclease
MKPSIIVWDLETVPDLPGFAAANDLVGKPDADIREALGNKFPKHIYHTIVCIGALVAHRESDHWAVDALGAPHVGERTEKQLISAFCDKIAELSPQLVTFNGNSFDLPVLRYRAMVHGVSAPGLSARPYFKRYTEDAIDLCDALSSFSPQGKASLHEISRVMGLPGKPKGFDGGEVERYFREGKIKEVCQRHLRILAVRQLGGLVRRRWPPVAREPRLGSGWLDAEPQARPVHHLKIRGRCLERLKADVGESSPCHCVLARYLPLPGASDR